MSLKDQTLLKGNDRVRKEFSRHPWGLKPPKPFFLAWGQLYKRVGMNVRVVLLTLSPSHPSFWEHLTTNRKVWGANPTHPAKHQEFPRRGWERSRQGWRDEKALVLDSEITSGGKKTLRSIHRWQCRRWPSLTSAGFLSKDSTSFQKRTNAMGVSEPSLGLEKQISSPAYRKVTNYIV